MDTEIALCLICLVTPIKLVLTGATMFCERGGRRAQGRSLDARGSDRCEQGTEIGNEREREEEPDPAKVLCVVAVAVAGAGPRFVFWLPFFP